MLTRLVRRLAALALVPAALVFGACGSDDAPPTPTPTATPLPPPTMTIVNETPCILHVYFDNQPQTTLGRVQPGKSQDFTEARLRDWSYMSIESTMAIFRKYDLRAVEADGWSVTVRSSPDDDPCVEQ